MAPESSCGANISIRFYGLNTVFENTCVNTAFSNTMENNLFGGGKKSMPKTLNVPNKAEPNSQAPKATALSQADFERLKPQKPQSTL
jgi:hypothetical protein